MGHANGAKMKMYVDGVKCDCALTGVLCMGAEGGSKENYRRCQRSRNSEAV